MMRNDGPTAIGGLGMIRTMLVVGGLPTERWLVRRS